MASALVGEHYVVVGGEPTYVTKCGPEPTDVLYLVIPGNPGCAAYYDEFIQYLVIASDHKVPAWTISHAGHVTMPNHLHEENGSQLDLYTLKGQIKHKVQFVRDHIPGDVKVILLGHSIGCYIILHMMEEIESRVLKCGLLFLTIERMAISKKGRVMTPLVKYFRWLAPILMFPISYLPEFIKKGFLNLYFWGRPVHSGSITGTQKLLSSPSINNIVNMANEEFQTVVNADYHLIESHMKKLWFYYGSCDHWCPVDYYNDMKTRYPQADIWLCKHGFEHAFCLEASKEMAYIVWQYMAENLEQLHVL